MSPELERLLEIAKGYQPTEEDRRKFIISFAWGNIHLDGSKATSEDVERAYDELYGGKDQA